MSCLQHRQRVQAPRSSAPHAPLHRAVLGNRMRSRHCIASAHSTRLPHTQPRPRKCSGLLVARLTSATQDADSSSMCRCCVPRGRSPPCTGHARTRGEYVEMVGIRARNGGRSCSSSCSRAFPTMLRNSDLLAAMVRNQTSHTGNALAIRRRNSVHLLRPWRATAT